VNKKLNVPRNSTTAIALPTAETFGHTGPKRDQKRGNDLCRTQRLRDRADAEEVVHPRHQRAVLDEHPGLHFRELAEADPRQHDHETVPAHDLTGGGQPPR